MATAQNPFDLNQHSGNELLNAATTAVAAPTTVGYDAATAGATGYNSSNAAATHWGVDPNQTVQGQVHGLIAANSPLMRQAEAQAKAQMNARGLTNSSMAVGAGHQAVMSAALPIASQDAQTHAQSAQFNAATDNQTSQFNAAAANQAAQHASDAANTASLHNAASQNQAAQFVAQQANQASMQYAETLNSTVHKMMDQSMQYALANADAQTRVELQQIDAQTRKDLAATEAMYKNQMQASASANEIFQQVSKNIADLMQNPDLETAAKQSAVDAQKQFLSSALHILSTTSGIPGLKNLISFG